MKEYENGNNGIESEVDVDLKEIKNESTEDNDQLRLQKPKKKINVKKIFIRSLVFIAGIIVGFVLAVIGTHENVVQYENTISDLNSTIESQQIEIGVKAKSIEMLNEKVADAEPWFAMKEDEQKAIEEENARKAEEERKAEEAKKEEERKAAEAKEKQGYETGITYNQLARTPDDYVGEKVKFKGKVIQVLEGDGVYNIRLAVGGNYDNIIYILGETSITDQRILENDYITVYGTSTGIYTYESTLGASISIPSMIVDKVDM